MVENISECGYDKNRSWNGLINASKAGNWQEESQGMIN